MNDDVPPTVLSPHETLQPTLKRPAPEIHTVADTTDSPEKTPPTILLNQERLLAQVPRTLHEGREAPLLGGVPLLTKIGQGGMGAVYLGVCPKSGERVAVKVLPLQLEDQTHAVDRFLREARLATVVKSPHLVAVRDVGHDNGLYFFQMEFVHGKSAGALLRANAASSGSGIDEGTALDICIAATQGLAAAHGAGIIHRDIKPDNILVPEDPASAELQYDKAKLADLGLARSLADDQTMTATQTALGTPGYMAPEQCRDAKRAEMSADVFSMGATLYALLAGRPPFQGRTSVDTILATLTRQHLPVKQFRSDVSEMTHEVIERCLSKEPRIRYENATKLLDALLICRDLRRGMSTLGPGLRVPAGVEVTVRDLPLSGARTPPLPAALPARTKTPAWHPAPVRRGPNLLALALGSALLAGSAVWLIRSPDVAQKAATRPAPATTPSTAPLAQPVQAPQALPATAPSTAPAQGTSASAEATVRLEAPTPAEVLLQRIHAGAERMPVTETPAKVTPPNAAAPMAKAPSEEELRQVRLQQQRREALSKAEAREAQCERDVASAREALQKAKSELDLAQREVERVQNDERGMKDQYAQMEMKLRSAPPPKPGGRKPGPGPAQDPRAQQMLTQFNEMQVKLRDRMTQAQQLLRDRSQALNRATYEVQKTEGLARQAGDEVKRLRESME